MVEGEYAGIVTGAPVLVTRVTVSDALPAFRSSSDCTLTRPGDTTPKSRVDDDSSSFPRGVGPHAVISRSSVSRCVRIGSFLKVLPDRALSYEGA